MHLSLVFGWAAVSGFTRKTGWWPSPLAAVVLVLVRVRVYESIHRERKLLGPNNTDCSYRTGIYLIVYAGVPGVYLAAQPQDSPRVNDATTQT